MTAYCGNHGLTRTMTDAPPAPTPLHLLRSHSAPISTLALSADNERIYSADATGRVVVSNTRTLRALAAWNAHTDSILGVEEWHTFVITSVSSSHPWTRSQG